MDTVWFEALHEYIQSDEWYQTIGVFIDSHCQLFSQETLKTSSAASNNGANTVAAFDHGQYHVYKEFVDISENILNNMLDSLGGSLDLLGQALDEHASLPPNGPRDNQRNEMINLLLTFDSFPHFTQMMSSKSFKQDYYDANPHHVRVTPQATSFDPNDLNNLTSMGFPTDACVNALTKCGGDFDEALQYLFDNPPSSPRGGGSKEAAPSAPPHPLETQVADLRSTRPNTLHRSASLSNISSATFVTQCEFAQAITDNHNPETSHLVPWAEQILELRSSMPFTDFSNPGPALQKALDMITKTLKSCEHAKNHSDIESSVEEMKKKGEDRKQRRNSSLDIKEAPDDNKASASEKQLDYMFKRREELAYEITEQRKEVVNYTKGGAATRISDDTLEELYLFLKEMVHNGEDLDRHKKRIHEYVFSRITSKSGSIVSCLLELMLLENEDYLLQRNINRLLNGESIDVDGGGGGEKEAKASENFGRELDQLHKANALDLENSKKALDAEAQRQRFKMQEQLRNKRKARLAAAGEGEKERVERELADEEAAALDRLDKRLGDRNELMLQGLQKKQVLVVDEFSKNKKALTSQQMDEINDRIAAELRAQHLKDLAAMRLSLESEKDRQKRTLQERLRRKRAGALGELDAGDDELAAEVIFDIDMEETKETNLIDSKFSRQMHALVKEPTEWFAATNIGVRLNYGSSSDGDGDVDWTDHLARMHKSHCDNLSGMEASLQDEKMRQTSQLQRRLQALRGRKVAAAVKRGASPEELKAVEDECEAFEAKARKQLDLKFAEQLGEIEKGVMEKHDSEVNQLVSSTDSDVLHKLALDSAFDFESAAAALTAAHERDKNEYEGALGVEKDRQGDKLREKLRLRQEKKRKELLNKGLSDGEIEEEMGFVRDEQQLEEYVEEDVGKGVMRVLKTRGGTREMVAEGPGAMNWAWGGEEGKVGEEEKGAEEKGEEAADFEGEADIIKKTHSKATSSLIDKLKADRKGAQKKLQDKLRARRAATLEKLRGGGASEGDIAAAEKTMEEEDLKERIQEDRMLTMAEHKAIEQEGEKNGVNTYALMDEIHAEFKDDREALHKQMQEEKERQKQEIARKRREKKEAKRAKEAVKRENEEEDVLLDFEDDMEGDLVEPEDLLGEVKKIQNQHIESRQTLDVMMQMEQARQKQALQTRLVKKRAEKRRNSVAVAGGSPLRK